MIVLAALCAGFSAGAIRARSVAAPAITRIAIVPVTGFIEAKKTVKMESGCFCGSQR
jgi:competence protein ComEC